jgi:hypothetical protein
VNIFIKDNSTFNSTMIHCTTIQEDILTDRNLSIGGNGSSNRNVENANNISNITKYGTEKQNIALKVLLHRW